MEKYNLPKPLGYENYKFPFVVEKPWGWERWIELWNDSSTGRGYCMKHLFIKKGTRTSLQYHNKKIETNFLIRGEVEAFLENENGEMDKKVMKAGDPERDTWSIPPGKVHRIHALTDIYLVESSTPEVDDVIRIEDDAGRGSGKIESEHRIKIEKHIYSREKCPLCLSRNLSEPIPPHKDLLFPILPVCVETPKEEDDFAPFNIGMCNECGLILLKEVVDPEILYKIFHSDGIGKVWEEHYTKFAKLIRKHCQKGKLLEIGAGQGKLIKKLLEMNFSEIEVMDPQYEGPRENIRLHNELLTNNSAQKLNEEFDMVVSSHTLEHFLEFKEYFENSWKVLKKGGLLFTSIPNQELNFSKGYGNMLNYEHPSVCMNAHWFYLHYKHGFMIREISFFQDHSVQIVAEKMDGPIDYKVDVKELSMKILNSYWNNIEDRMNKIRKFAKEDKENWIFGASNFSQPLFVYGLEETFFKGVLDNSPLKHNKRLYGTNLICRKPEEVLKENPNIRIFLNLGFYNQEVFEQLKSLNPNVECIFL